MIGKTIQIETDLQENSFPKQFNQKFYFGSFEQS